MAQPNKYTPQTNFAGGCAREDWLDGGSGNDVLYGGAGGDTYIYGKNYGHDTIVDCGDPCDTDRIEFKSDICLTDLCFTASHGNLIISAGKGDSITVKNWFYGEQNQIEMLSFNSNDISVSNEQNNAAFNHSSYGASVSGASLAAMVQEQAAQTAAVI